MEIELEKISPKEIEIIAESVEKEIERRRIQLWLHRYLYYQLDKNIISDFDYDKKEREYRVLRTENPKVKVYGNCPLERVGVDMDRITEGKVLQLVGCLEKGGNRVYAG